MHETYFLSKKELRLVKECAKYAGLPWQAIASRPSTAMEFCEKVKEEIEETWQSG